MSNHERLVAAAHALTPKLRDKVVFVGGCTVHLYMDADQKRVDIRPTEDVDVIVEVYSLIDWYKIEQEIRDIGFLQTMSEDDPICRYRLGSIVIDFMPTEESVLGFSNPWYTAAINSFYEVNLASSISIRYIHLQYFLLTKFAAYEGRGKDDLMASKDIEDILMVFAGRKTIERELGEVEGLEKSSLLNHLVALINHADFSYAVMGCFPTSDSTAKLVKARINNAIKFIQLG